MSCVCASPARRPFFSGPGRIFLCVLFRLLVYRDRHRLGPSRLDFYRLSESTPRVESNRFVVVHDCRLGVRFSSVKVDLSRLHLDFLGLQLGPPRTSTSVILEPRPQSASKSSRLSILSKIYLCFLFIFLL